jgi:hypothetical protein
VSVIEGIYISVSEGRTIPVVDLDQDPGLRFAFGQQLPSVTAFALGSAR